MHTSTLLLPVLGCAAVTSALAIEQRGKTPNDPTGGPYLNKAAQAAGKLFFGTATDIPGPEQKDKEYMKILNNTDIWGQLTPGNGMKVGCSSTIEQACTALTKLQWVYTEPEPDMFDYSYGDVVLDIAEAHGKKVRCHNLVWYEELPSWVSSGKWTNLTLQAAMQNHIETIVEHWGGRCYSWDVVNEALNDDGTYQANVFYNNIGAAYIPLAFQYAATAVAKTGKDIKLFYNDYSLEYGGAKTNAAANIVRDLQARKIRIDGVGLESHFIVGGTPSQATQVQAMEIFTNLGVDVQRTEIDVRFTSLPPDASGTHSLAQQATDYYNTVASCMQVKRCTGMTQWDFDDKYSWIQPTFPGQGRADLYNANFSRKPAYRACWEAIVGKPCTVCN